jgi:hypothetical protein
MTKKNSSMALRGSGLAMICATHNMDIAARRAILYQSHRDLKSGD